MIDANPDEMASAPRGGTIEDTTVESGEAVSEGDTAPRGGSPQADADGDIELRAMMESAPLVQALRNVDIAEIYSPARVTAYAKKMGLQSGEAMDLTTGWDFRHEKKDGKKVCRRGKAAIADRKPDVHSIQPDTTAEWTKGGRREVD